MINYGYCRIKRDTQANVCRNRGETSRTFKCLAHKSRFHLGVTDSLHRFDHLPRHGHQKSLAPWRANVTTILLADQVTQVLPLYSASRNGDKPAYDCRFPMLATLARQTLRHWVGWEYPTRANVSERCWLCPGYKCEQSKQHIPLHRQRTTSLCARTNKRTSLSLSFRHRKHEMPFGKHPNV